MFKEKIKIIGFDADDTLWINEPYYKETEDKLCRLLKNYSSPENTSKELFKIEIKNLKLYGYGAKAFILSLIETALQISHNKIKGSEIEKIIGFGKDQINRKNELLPGVEKVLSSLSANYRCILATKGDLLDQERKLSFSGLSKYFHHIEIMSDKKTLNYQHLLKNLEIAPEHFLMVGNSIKSDILPVLELGGNAIYIPFHTTWEHEEVAEKHLTNLSILSVSSIEDIIQFF